MRARSPAVIAFVVLGLCACTKHENPEATTVAVEEVAPVEAVAPEVEEVVEEPPQIDDRPLVPKLPPKDDKPVPFAPPPRYQPIPADAQLLVPVSQARPEIYADSWLFVYGRTEIDFELEDECVTVDVATGTILDRSNPQGDSICEAVLGDGEIPRLWPERWLDGSFDNTMELDFDDAEGKLLFLDADGELLRSAPCPGCLYETTTWAPTNYRVAGLDVQATPRLDIWDAEKGERVASLSFSVPGEIDAAEIVWNERGIVILVDHGDYERDVYEASTWFWPEGAKAIGKRRSLTKDGSFDDYERDELGYWIAVYDEKEERDGDVVKSHLRVLSLTDLESKIDWRWTEDYSVEPYDEEAGRWRSGVAGGGPQWIETKMSELEHLNERVDVTLSWRVLAVGPEPRAAAKQLYSGRNLDPEKTYAIVEVYGLGPERPLLQWTLDEFAEPRPRTLLGDGVCDVVDASPGLDLLLAECSDLVLMDVKTGETAMAINRPAKSEVEWVGEHSLAVIGPAAGLALVDTDAREMIVDRGDIVGFTPLALGYEHGRFAVHTAAKVEILDSATGATLLELPAFAGQAALDPSGARLAYVEGGTLRVVDAGTGKLLASWSEPDGPDVAYRQDGAALLVGDEVPSRMVDPLTGELLAVLSGGNWEKMEAEDLDPSWRWARLADGRIMRTLDGMGMRFGDGWFRLDCGVYEGAIGAKSPELKDVLYRASDEPFARPRLTAAKVDRWVRREGVAKAFFAGEAIALPTIPKAELAKL